MNENDFELELNLNEKKKLINNNKEYQKKIKNSKGRHNLQNIINQKNINLKEIFSSPTNKKRIREKDEEENIKNIEKKKKIKIIHNYQTLNPQKNH